MVKGKGNGGKTGLGGNGGQGWPAVAAITEYRFRELVNLPHSQSPVEPKNFLIDSGSEISMCRYYDVFSFVEPCDLKSCTHVGSTTLNINSVGIVRFCLGTMWIT